MLHSTVSTLQLLTLIIPLGCMASGVSAEDVWDVERQANHFESRIRPLLLEHCVECHALDTEASGGLLLDSRAGWQAGGDSANAIVPGDSAASRVVRAVRYHDPDLQMPPEGKLPDEAILDIVQWIDAGAFDPREAVNGQLPKVQGLAVSEAQSHWAYRDVSPIPVPILESGVGANAIDAFINRKLAERGLIPAPRASDEALLRRLYFDLLGRPPQRAESREGLRLLGLGDQGHAQLVDQLLANVQYAETFARRWMDVVRYAESITLRGFVLPQAWRYRDYLIEAYAEDRPFDQMIREQIAGDLLPASDCGQEQRQLIATAFLVLGNTNLEKQDKTQLEMDTIDEQLEVIGRAFLGQTLGCARCHDHKFDPIPTRDYYALAGILRSAVSLEHDNVSKWIELPLPNSDSPAPNEGDSLPDKQATAMYMTLVEKLAPQDIPIHIRGEAHNLGSVVPRGFLTALHRESTPPIPEKAGGRVELAKWLSSVDNPLTARVYANRIWSWLMTQGIVPTVNNFGTTGVAPTHPELLDWLARELVQHEWSTKHLVRTIVLSDTYCRARIVVAQSPQFAEDPGNRLWWRGPSRRLTVEALRDAMLQISGELDAEVGGSLIASETKVDYDYIHRTTRRSVYHPVFRNALPELFEAFDFADPSSSIGQRPRSTVATQGLVLLNHPWVVARARAAATRFSAECSEHALQDLNSVVVDLYQLCLSRPPTADELAACSDFLNAASASASATPVADQSGKQQLPVQREALETLIHSLFASLDFRFLD